MAAEIIFGPGEVWWHPIPKDGEIVPPHPPVLLGRFTDLTVNGDMVDEISQGLHMEGE